MSSNEKIIKASFRGNPSDERKTFLVSTCLMPISVGQSVHEGKKFEAVIKLVDKSFKQCAILIDDTVQRHTIAIDKFKEPQDLYTDALELGNQWLIRNEGIYSQLKIPYQIIRWDDWLRHNDFKMQLARVNRLYSENLVYKTAIHANINEFLTRFLSKIDCSKIDSNRAFQLCLNYLLEECAVMLLWTHGHYDFELYPNGRNQAMGATYEILIKPYFPSYLRSVAVRFKKYPRQNIFQNQSIKSDILFCEES